MLRTLSLRGLVEGWAVEILAEISADSRGLGLPRVSPMFSRIADTAEQDQGDREEVKAFRAALVRLHAEQPDEHAAVLRAVRAVPVTRPDDEPAVIAGMKRVAEWVDAEMGGE